MGLFHAVFLGTVIGVRNAPLAYIVWDIEAVHLPPPLVLNRPYSEEHGSVEWEMIARMLHDLPVFDDDNGTCFNHSEKATRGTIIAATIQSFKRRQNGRGDWRVIIAQHYGDDKWESDIKSSDDFLKTRIWKGNKNHSLERFIGQHSSGYITLQQCAEHVTY